MEVTSTQTRLLTSWRRFAAIRRAAPTAIKAAAANTYWTVLEPVRGSETVAAATSTAPTPTHGNVAYTAGRVIDTVLDAAMLTVTGPHAPVTGSDCVVATGLPSTFTVTVVDAGAVPLTVTGPGVVRVVAESANEQLPAPTETPAPAGAATA